MPATKGHAYPAHVPDVVGPPAGSFLRDDLTWAAPGGGPPAAHKASHENTGGDEISVAGLSGVLADPQTPAGHSHGGGDITSPVAAATDADTVDGQHAAAFALASHTQAGSTVLLDKVGSPTYETAQHFARFCGTAGRIIQTELIITDAGGGTITVSGGDCTLRTAATEDAPLVFAKVAALGATAIPASTARYVGVEHNAGSPQIVVRTSDNWNYLTDFPVGQVIHDGTDLHVEQNGREFSDQLGRMIRRFRGTRPYERDERMGGLILGETGTRNVTVTAGRLWDRSNDWDITAIDTSAASTFDSYYYTGAAWVEVGGRTQWDNLQYNDMAAGLATLGAAKWGVHWFYLDVSGALHHVYGQAQYNTQASAAAASAPASLPPWAPINRIIGRIIFQKSVATGIVETVFSTTFTASGVTDHGNLAGLSDLDHPATAIVNAPAGGIAATDVQSAINELDTEKASTTDPRFEQGTYGYFGDGSDGDVTITIGTVPGRAMYYNNLTINDTKFLAPDGFPIFVRNTCTINGSIERPGVDGGNGADTGGGAGTAGTANAAQYLGGSGAGGAGGTASGAGANSAAVSNSACSATWGGGGGRGAVGGAGGGGLAGGSSPGAVGVPGVTTGRTRDYISISTGQVFGAGGQTRVTGGSGGSGGGGGGAASATGGGGGGGAGAPLVLCARDIVIGATGSISVAGGNGGRGGNCSAPVVDGNGGGGGGGTKLGTGTAGVAGSDGQAGILIQLVV